jgi:hypothetical protein
VCGPDSPGLRSDPFSGPYKQDNEPSGSMEGGYFHEELRNFQLPKITIISLTRLFDVLFILFLCREHALY